MKLRVGIVSAVVLAFVAAMAVGLHAERSKAKQPSPLGRTPVSATPAPRDAGGPSPVVVRAATIDPATVRRLGTLGKRSDVAFSLFLGRNAKGEQCLITVSHSSRTALSTTGLSFGPDLFAGHSVAADVRTFGGAPGATYVIGLVRPDVSRIEVVDAVGASQVLHPTSTGTFRYGAGSTQPTGVVAYDKGGRRIDRVALH